MTPALLAEAAAMLRASGQFPTEVQLEKFVANMFDPERDFLGQKVQLLRQAAAPFLTADERSLLSVPIGFLHTEELNGCAVLTPRGGQVILLDLGVLLHMHLLGRSILALTSWSSPAPFCRDHEPVAWVRTIVALAKHALTLDDSHLAGIPTWHCPSLDAWDLKSAKFGANVELFVYCTNMGILSVDTSIQQGRRRKVLLEYS